MEDRLRPEEVVADVVLVLLLSFIVAVAPVEEYLAQAAVMAGASSGSAAAMHAMLYLADLLLALAPYKGALVFAAGLAYLLLKYYRRLRAGRLAP